MKVNALHISADSKVTEIEIDSDDVRIIARYSNMAHDEFNVTATNITYRNVNGPIIIALKRDGQYINFDKTMLDHVSNTLKKERLKRSIE